MRTTPTLGGGLHALHAILLAVPVALFPAALVADIAYLRTAEMQWSNFAAWLIAGAMVFTGVVLAWALLTLLVRFRSRDRLSPVIKASLLAGVFGLGLINAFQHSRDAWSSVGATGLVLSILCSLLILAVAVLTHTSVASREIAQ